jgi:hypothetical protein
MVACVTLFMFGILWKCWTGCFATLCYIGLMCTCSSPPQWSFYTRHFLPVMLFSVLQMDHTISYTKNGTNLGVAFRNVKGNCFFLHLLMYWICTTRSQSGYGSQTCRMNYHRSITCTCAGLVLYPTVGLRTPGEKVEANFGAKPFVFNLEGFQQVWALIAPLHLASMVWWPCHSRWHPFMSYSA